MAKQIITNLDNLVDEVVSTNINAVAAIEAVAEATAKASEATSKAAEAGISADLAKDYANKVPDSQVETGTYSARHYAAKAEADKILADSSAAMAVDARNNAVQEAIEARVARVGAEDAENGAYQYLQLTNDKFDEFSQWYLGPQISDPIVDNKGGILAEGAIYWNIPDDIIRVYTGTKWLNLVEAVGFLAQSQNLADVKDVVAARSNLDVLSTQEVNDAAVAMIDNLKGQPDGIAGLDASGLVPTSQLPSYVDDVVEVATYADLPVTGESGKIYVVVSDETSNGDTSIYRWTGTMYAMVSNTLNATDVKNLYESNADTNVYTDAEKARVDVVTTLDTATTTLPTAINEVHGELDAHVAATGAHGVGTIVGTTEGQILTNKTINDISNVVGADHVHYPVRNGSGATIIKGTVVTGSTTQPDTDYIEVVPVTDPQTEVALGIVTSDLANNAVGLAINTGVSTAVSNTSAWAVGTILYPNTMGGLTSTKITSGRYQACAVVTRSHNTQGTLLVEFTEPKYIASTTQSGYVQLNDTLTSTSTTEALTANQGKELAETKYDISEASVMNLDRADKYLSAQDIANMIYTGENLTKIQYNNATDVDYEVLTYGVDGLNNIAHYVGGTLAGNTQLTYTAGELTSAVFTGV